MKKHGIFIFLIIFLTLLTWYKLYFQSLLGEGYLYFKDSNHFPIVGPQGNLENLYRYDNQARLIYVLMEKVFKDNIRSFFIFLLIVLVLQNISFYFMVFKLSKERIVAFLSSIFFGISYVYLFEMVGIGYFQWPSERVPNFIFSFIAFYLYLTFLKSFNKHIYFLSLIIFLFSVLLAHYSIFFLTMFIFYTLFLLLFKERSIKQIAIRILYLAPFILGSLFITSKNQFIDDKGSLLVFALHEKNLPQEVLNQITAVIIPFNLWPLLEKYMHLSPSFINPKLYFLVVLFFILSLIYVFKKRKEWGIILASCISSLVILSVFNLYTNRSAIIYLPFDSNRYYFTLGFFASIYLSLILYLLLYKNNNYFLRSILIIFFLWWIASNINKIWLRDRERQLTYLVNYKTQAYIRQISSRLKSNSIIIVPSDIGVYGSEFYKKFYGNNTMIFTPITHLRKEYVYKFDPRRDYILEYDITSGEIVNRASSYQEIFRNKKLIL